MSSQTVQKIIDSHKSLVTKLSKGSKKDVEKATQTLKDTAAELKRKKK